MKKVYVFYFFYLWREELKTKLNDAFTNPLLDSINIIFIYTINFFNILNLICVYLSEVFPHCLLKENIHFQTLGYYCCFTS